MEKIIEINPQVTDPNLEFDPEKRKNVTIKHTISPIAIINEFCSFFDNEFVIKIPIWLLKDEKAKLLK